MFMCMWSWLDNIIIMGKVKSILFIEFKKFFMDLMQSKIKLTNRGVCLKSLQKHKGFTLSGWKLRALKDMEHLNRLPYPDDLISTLPCTPELSTAISTLQIKEYLITRKNHLPDLNPKRVWFNVVSPL